MLMKVRIKGRDGGDVVCLISDGNFDPSSMTVIEREEHERR